MAQLAIVFAALLASCSSTSAMVSAPGAPATPVPDTDLVRALVEVGPYTDFTLQLHPMAMPRQGHLECHWSERKLDGYEFVDTGAPGGQWWRLPTPPNSAGLGEPNLSLVHETIGVVDGRIARLASDGGSKTGALWHAAFFCGHADLAVFNVGYYCGALCGQGFRITLQKQGSDWKLIDVLSTWAA